MLERMLHAAIAFAALGLAGAATGTTEDIRNMLLAGSRGDQATVLALEQKGEAEPKPQRGERKIARKLNTDALERLKARDFSAAIRILSEAERADPRDQEVVNNLGYAYLEAGDLRSAESAFYRALLIQPGRVSAWANLGMLHGQVGNEAIARGGFWNALLFQPDAKKDTTINYLREFGANSPHAAVRNAIEQALNSPPAARAVPAPSAPPPVADAPPPAVVAPQPEPKITPPPPRPAPPAVVQRSPTPTPPPATVSASPSSPTPSPVRAESDKRWSAWLLGFVLIVAGGYGVSVLVSRARKQEEAALDQISELEARLAKQRQGGDKGT